MNTRLREVSQGDFAPQQETPVQQAQAQASNASVQLLLLALKTLSQRFVIALAAIRGMILAGSVFGLSYMVCTSPDTLKLVGLGIYSGFILMLEAMIMRRK